MSATSSRAASRLHHLEVERSVAFDEQQALRGLVTGSRVPVVPAGLHHVAARTEPYLRLSFRRLDVRARQEHDLHGVGVRVEGNRESCRQLQVRAERPLGMVAPQIGDLDTGSAGWIEVGPFQIGGWREDRLACPRFRWRGGFRGPRFLRQSWRRQRECDRKRQNDSCLHQVPP